MSSSADARRRPVRRAAIAVALAVAVGALAAALLELPEVWAMSRPRATVKLWLWWGLAALLPLGLLCIAALPRLLREHAWLRLALSVVAIAGIGALLWARHVEPQQLHVVETEVSTLCGVRIALVSDIHRGVYGRASHLATLVARLNALPVDAVLVAGDWTYEPPRDLQAAFAAWRELRHPSIGVLGNHDEQRPGPPLQKALRAALEKHGVQWAEGRRLALGRCELVGLGDFDAGSDRRDLALLQHVPSDVPAARRIVLAHNPDSAALVTPWLLARRTESGLQRGLYETPHGRVFVTSGTGMSKLPLRLRMPPTIDVLRL